HCPPCAADQRAAESAGETNLGVTSVTARKLALRLVSSRWGAPLPGSPSPFAESLRLAKDAPHPISSNSKTSPHPAQCEHWMLATIELQLVDAAQLVAFLCALGAYDT